PYEQGPYLITSMGIGGSNAVTLLESHQSTKNTLDLGNRFVIPIFARNKLGIEQQIRMIKDYSLNGKLTGDFIVLIYSIANIKNMTYRGYIEANRSALNGNIAFDSHYDCIQGKSNLIFRFHGESLHLDNTVNPHMMCPWNQVEKPQIYYTNF